MKRYLYIALSAIAFIGFAGCAKKPTEATLAQYNEACTNFGFQPGSVNFENCRLQQESPSSVSATKFLGWRNFRRRRR
jgi:hypothetical protein